MVILLVSAASVATFLGGLMALQLRHRLDLIVSFSAGAMIALVLLDLLPEALGLSLPQYSADRVTLVVAVGFFFFMVLHSPATPWSHHDEECERQHHRGELGAGSLCVHSFLDGMGIGLGFQVSLTVGLLITAGIVTHDFSDGVNTVSLILRHRSTVRRAFGWLVVDALAPAAGALSTLFFTLPPARLGLALALFSGFFLYIGASDLLPESHRRSRSAWPLFLTILGAVTLYAAIRLAKR